MKKRIASKSDARPAEETSIVVEYPDNRHMTGLFGEHNRNLALIEARLGIGAESRGNRLRLVGGEDAVRTARQILDRLYSRLEANHTVTTADVEAAIRLARAEPALEEAGEALAIRTRKRTITPRSPGQVRYIRALQNEQITFGLGPAGTGKTFLAVAWAVSRLIAGSVDRIILSRPAVEAGERLGFLPGDLREKIDPYLRPLYDALNDTLPADEIAKRLERNEIEVAPLAYMRGRTLSNCVVILDEAQNTTPMQMKMFLTRLGENCQMVVAGDPSQTDLPSVSQSGLNHALRIVGDIPGIAVVRFAPEDVVRHALVGAIVAAYDRADEKARARAAQTGDGTDDQPAAESEA